MGKAPKLVTTNPAEHPSVRAWKRLAGKTASPRLILVLERKQKGSGCRLYGLGTRGGEVIAKQCHPERARVERFVYERVAPTLPPRLLDDSTSQLESTS